MPCVSTLKLVQSIIPSTTGVSDSLKKKFQERVHNMSDPKEKVALLMWDEIELLPHVDYERKGDQIIAVEEWGEDFRSEKIGIDSLIFRAYVLFRCY